VNAESWIGLGVAAGLVLHLLATLLFPERF
jgi:K+-transporting ATPase KdpF subunit